MESTRPKAHFRTRTPQGDGNMLITSLVVSRSFIISEHEPRKGTETSTLARLLAWFPLFQNTNPARGRKLFKVFTRFNCLACVNFRTRTPQGDGNIALLGENLVFAMISEHEPRKGTETINEKDSRTVKLCISEHEPRKGTETILYVCMFHLHEKSFRNTNPARGRKRDRRGSGNDRQGRLEFQNTNPERGRKQSIGFSYFHILFNGNFKTRTPKGDGNSEPSSCTSPKTFQNTNPERGRKPVRRNRGFFLGVREFQNTNPERGRKLYHPLMEEMRHIAISEHEPRKGTEIGYDFLLMKSQPVVYVLSLQCILLILN